MQHAKGTVRATGADEPRSAGRSARWTRIIAFIAVPAIVAAAVLLVTAHQATRKEREERRGLAEAASLDRRTRDDQIRVWNVALNSDPSSALALSQLAALNVQKARETGQESFYPIAEEMARRSLSLRTHRNARTYVVLTSALLAQHRFKEARTAAAEALALEPDVAQYRALLAEIDMELGDYGAATQGFAGLGAYATHLSIGPRLARWEEVNGRAASARRILEELVEQADQRHELPREQNAWFNFRLGDHYRRHGSPRRARASFERALAVNPGDYRAHKALAELELSLGDAKSAVRYARAAVSESRTPETLLTLANALRESNDAAQAASIEAEVAQVIGPDGGSFERAWHAYRLDWGLASGEITPLLESEARERGDVQGYDLLAWAYYKSNRIPEARAAVAKALRSNTSDAIVWYHAGVIHRASGDYRRAKAYLQHSLRLNPAFNRRAAATASAMLDSLERSGDPD